MVGATSNRHTATRLTLMRPPEPRIRQSRPERSVFAELLEEVRGVQTGDDCPVERLSFTGYFRIVSRGSQAPLESLIRQKDHPLIVLFVIVLAAAVGES